MSKSIVQYLRTFTFPPIAGRGELVEVNTEDCLNATSHTIYPCHRLPQFQPNRN